MTCKTSYDLHHNFPRLAEETGFAFNTHRPRVHIDWNKIRLIDIESLARDRKFVIIEQHVNDILDCVLESEFDVRILDEGVVKLFRLAQLAVEYQQFCRHYLDRSVFVLRQEIDTLAQDLAATKKDLVEKEDELRNLKRKGKHNYRSVMSYGNDNIATMILKTLTNKSDIFQPTANGEVPQYNKCHFCDKVFLNQLYLKSHISRRHVNMVDEFPRRDEKDGQNNVNNGGHENIKLTEEINELKLKIREMELLITNNNKVAMESANITKSISVDPKTEIKDAEVSTNNDDVFVKLEEWKKAEQESHTNEIKLLKNQIFETLNSFKANENKKSDENENNIVEQLKVTIEEQGAEILALKQALTHSKLKNESGEKERKKEVEEQMLFWAKRDETQSKQYELLLEKLNDVAKDARESRALAEAERQRAGKLEALLKEKQNNGNRGAHSSTDPDEISSSQEGCDHMASQESTKNSKPVVDHDTLKSLHRKAQELLYMKSSSSSDISSAENIANHHHVIKTVPKKSPKHNSKQRRVKNHLLQPENELILNKTNKVPHSAKSSDKYENNKLINHKGTKLKKEPSNASQTVLITQECVPTLPSGSPVRVVRAKITEEVNNRLVQAGVDPLKSRLNQGLFQKQKSQLQQQLELKSKKYPAYEQVRYTIMAYLDSDTTVAKRIAGSRQDEKMPITLTKAFSLHSMVSNIKSKALSLVKTKERRKTTSSLESPPDLPVGLNIRRSSPKLEIVEEVDSNGKHKNDSNITHLNRTKMNRISKKVESSPSPVDGVDSDSSESNNHFTIAIPQRPARSIDNLIKSPARRPSSANAEHSNTVLKYKIDNDENDTLMRTQSVTNVSQFVTGRNDLNDEILTERKTASTEDLKALKVTKSDNNKIMNFQQTKSVLKNASSINKKKVIFDMDAIQMKSVSASPSQSITDKSEDKYELGLVNIGDDEWDISSIENEPIKNDTKIRVSSGQGLKIAELKQSIEAQLARRSETPSTAVIGGVDMLRAPMTKTSTIGGSNTSLGSSILDDSDSTKVINQKTLVKPKKVAEKDDSELDISDFSIDGVTNKNEKDSF